ncbi:MAG: CARDB domain-containing protein, partial [Candidatus Bathyarchaeia archaeon]
LRLDIASETSPALRTKILDSARKTITLNYGGTTYTYTSPPAPPEIATIYVDPEEIIDPTLLPPAVFHVNITINNVQNLYEYEFNMSFNNQVLTCLYIIIHDVQGETNYMPEMQINNPKGFIWIRVTYYPPANPITTTTPLALATIQFRVKSVGASVLDLHDTQLINNQGNPITHEAKDGYVMTLIRDIAITSVVPSRNWAYAEWPVNISVTVKNLGYITENFTVSAYYDTNLIGTLEILNLSPSEERTVTLLWNTTGLSQGNYTLSARAPALQFETNIANNVYVDGQITILTAIRDIAITNVSTPSWTYQGWIVDITVTVKNLGTSVESFNVTIYLDETAINTTKIVNLPPSSEVNLTFKWNTSEATPCNTYIVWAEATLTPYEYNTTNNLYVDGTIKVRIMGDINGDGLVDITDIAAVSDAYGSAPGAPNWNPAADVNQDELIDVEDVALVSSKFGSIC